MLRKRAELKRPPTYSRPVLLRADGPFGDGRARAAYGMLDPALTGPERMRFDRAGPPGTGACAGSGGGGADSA